MGAVFKNQRYSEVALCDVSWERGKVEKDFENCENSHIVDRFVLTKSSNGSDLMLMMRAEIVQGKVMGMHRKRTP